MEFDTHNHNITALKKQNVILGVSLLSTSIALLLSVGWMIQSHERIVVVPPGLSGPVAIDWGHADAEYLKTFGVFYATLLGSITPRNVSYVADRLTSMTAPHAYPPIRKSILAAGKDPSFAGSGSATNFVSNQVVQEYETGKVFVAGENRVYSGFGQPKITPVVYEMDIRIIEGRPVVFSVINYPGTDPRTLEWKIAHPDWNKPKDDKND